MDSDDMSVTFQIVDMTENEDRMAVEAHARTLVLLRDALKKKDRLLLDGEMEYEKRKESHPDCPFLHQQLVLDLIQKLQIVQLLKDGGLGNEADVATVYPAPNSDSVFLCQSFWERQEYLGLRSRPGTLILAASHILGYVDNIWGKGDDGTLTASDICAAFESWMNHAGVYEHGVYTCCGEQVRDSLCEQSHMSHYLLPYMTESVETELKQATLDILLDSQKKCLLIELTEEPDALLTNPKFPIIKTSLVQELISKLKEVRFKCDNSGDNTKIAYTDPRTRNVIYVCPLFWEEKDYLCPGSRLGTIILYVAQLLGYPHHLDGATKGNTCVYDVQNHKSFSSPTSLTETLDQDIHNRGPTLSLCSSSPSNIGDLICHRSETSAKDETTADTICSAFELWMTHKGNYENGIYTCCMETARHSVCTESVMRSCLKELQSLTEQDPSAI